MILRKFFIIYTLQYIFCVKLDKYQKQPQEVFYKKHVLKNSEKFTGEHLYQGLFVNKVVDLRVTPSKCLLYKSNDILRLNSLLSRSYLYNLIVLHF